MGNLKTAALVATLNLFSLNLAFGDAFYDAVKASGKTDPASIDAIRKTTIENPRAQQMNALTQSNPAFVPLSQSAPQKKYSDLELKKMQDAELNDPQEKDDGVAVVAKVPPPLAAPAASNPKNVAVLGPLKSDAPNDSPTTKVINTDPDEVVFSGDEKPAKSAPLKKP
jgi:hypothetical protein